MMQQPTISVIMPVLNEGRTIASLLEIIRTWGRATQIIVVVDEATTDETQAILKRFGKAILSLRNSKGRGKGDAIATGIARATGEVLLLIDGDITSLMHRDLTELVEPVITRKAEMAIGVLKYWKAGSYEPFNGISGTRALLRSTVVNHIAAMRTTGYGVELFLNDLHKQKRVVYVRLPYVYVLNKFEKQTVPEAIRSYIRESRELIAESIRRTGELQPQVKQVLLGVQRYLKRALDSLQLE